MGRAYILELARLANTVAISYDADVKPLVSLLSPFATCNLILVGSGGSFTAATFGAALHEEYTGYLAKAVTPLEAVAGPDTTNTAALLLSARGSNPDILRAFQVVRLKYPIAAICATADNALLQRISKGGGNGYGFSVPGGKDGFLATNSMIATVVLLIRAYETLMELPAANLHDLGKEPVWFRNSETNTYNKVRELANMDTLIALSSGWGWPAAVDIESKFSETGLGNVLLSDYRNFAHGRHNWLRRRGETTAIISLEDSANTKLAEEVLSFVPDEVKVCRLISQYEGPVASVDLMSQVLYLTGLVGEAVGIDPGRPPVAIYGRRMYRNGFRVNESRSTRETWIERKANAIGILPYGDRKFLGDALDRFLEELRQANFQAIITDYDGTLCNPSERFTGPKDEVFALLINLLRKGLILGIATGRGGSAYEAMHGAIPKDLWGNVLLGLYNGAVVVSLTEEPSDIANNDSSRLSQALETLNPLISRLPIRVSHNEYQLSLIPTRPISLERLRRSVMELLHDIIPPNFVRESSHSVDIISRPNCKESVLREVEKRVHDIDLSSATLCIGDIGDWGGNDFDLLHNRLSLSVDRISANLGTCWNLGPPGSRGVTTAVRYFQALKPTSHGFRFDVDSLLKSGLSRGVRQ